MPHRRQLANAIRALSMDAVSKRNQDTLACPWAWPILPKYYGMIF